MKPRMNSFTPIGTIMEKTVIGRFDRVDFPELGLRKVKVKIDTGAYNSSIHVTDLREDEHGVHFIPLTEGRKGFAGKQVSMPEFEKRIVRSSNGEIEERYLIETKVILFGEVIPLKMTLTDRSQMRFPILIGRSLLNKGFVIDVSRTYLSFKTER
jgi:hypothetical protein